ncbi:MAG: thiamine pyrophosphate-dependent dehydrogenase E1 component subunit alpha [Planctomycetes bacterium]|nr:thiamine pyrophosphate-dependent dehydrogenase E1 component subunit alpha [Planctomycetota bacterium]
MAEKAPRAAPRDKAARRRHETLGLTDADCVRLFELLVTTRAMDDAVASLYRRGELPGGAFSSRGQEATAVGSCFCLNKNDVIGPVIRNSGAILTQGLSPVAVLRNFLGRADSPTRGRDGNTHLGCMDLGIIAPTSHLGTLIPVCAGAALAFKSRGEARVALTWIGDGAASIGDFHEGLNIAAVWRLPFVLIIENNGWAYSTPTSHQTLLADLSRRAEGYGIPGASFDGNDILEVIAHTRPAVERARAGEGPTLLEARTFRMKGHAEHDDASYVPRELVEHWKARDPIDGFERYLHESGVLTPDETRALRARVAADMERMEREALASPFPDAGTVAAGVFAEGEA